MKKIKNYEFLWWGIIHYFTLKNVSICCEDVLSKSFSILDFFRTARSFKNKSGIEIQRCGYNNFCYRYNEKNSSEK